MGALSKINNVAKPVEISQTVPGIGSGVAKTSLKKVLGSYSRGGNLSKGALGGILWGWYLEILLNRIYNYATQQKLLTQSNHAIQMNIIVLR